MSLSASILQSATILFASREFFRFASSAARTRAGSGLWAPSTHARAFFLPGKGVYRPGHLAPDSAPRTTRANPFLAASRDAATTQDAAQASTALWRWNSPRLRILIRGREVPGRGTG